MWHRRNIKEGRAGKIPLVVEERWLNGAKTRSNSRTWYGQRCKAGEHETPSFWKDRKHGIRRVENVLHITWCQSHLMSQTYEWSAHHSLLLRNLDLVMVLHVSCSMGVVWFRKPWFLWVSTITRWLEMSFDCGKGSKRIYLGLAWSLTTVRTLNAMARGIWSCPYLSNISITLLLKL